MKNDGVGGNIEGSKKWNPLDVVPMKVGHEDIEGNVFGRRFPHQFQTEIAQTGAAVNDQDAAIGKAYLDATRVPSETEKLRLGRWDGTAHSPELQFDTKWVADRKSP
jgi:hypothetical protein